MRIILAVQMQVLGLFKDTVEQTKGKDQQASRDLWVLGHYERLHKHHERMERWVENLAIVKKL